MHWFNRYPVVRARGVRARSLATIAFLSLGLGTVGVLRASGVDIGSLRKGASASLDATEGPGCETFINITQAPATPHVSGAGRRCMNGDNQNLCAQPNWTANNVNAYGEPQSGVRLVDSEPYGYFGSVLLGMRDASGTMYRRNRYYDPASGRFTQEDPIGLAGGANLYGFAARDPVNYSDPFGLSWWDKFKERVGREWKETVEGNRRAIKRLSRSVIRIIVRARSQWAGEETIREITPEAKPVAPYYDEPPQPDTSEPRNEPTPPDTSPAEQVREWLRDPWVPGSWPTPPKLGYEWFFPTGPGRLPVPPR